MKKLIWILCFVMFGSTAAFAEDQKIGNMTLDELKKALGMSVYFQGGYTYNGKAGTIGGEQEQNDLRVFDHKANSFTLDLAQIIFTKDAPTDGVGYKLKLSAGETAKWIHSRGLSGVDPNLAPPANSQTGPGTDAFDVTEAYVSYLAPLGKGLKFDFGKFVTYHGAEVIEAKDDLNYSRSFLFNYAIPFTHTGLRMTYTFSDALNVGVHIVNGWDNSTDNNKGKTYGLSIGYTPIEAISTTFNFMSGPEQDNNNSNNRFLFDWVGILKPAKKVTVTLNVDYGREQNVPAIGPAKWSGIAGYVTYDFTDKYSMTARGEYFDDQDGARTLTAQRLTEVTVTPQIKLAQNLLLRPEYRHDKSDKQSFDNGTKKDQDTIALGVMYTW